MKQLLYLILAVLLCSCSKTVADSSSDIVPDGYVKLSFTSDVVPVDVKSTLEGASHNWTGDEKVHVWYKKADGTTAKILANIDSVNGSKASFSVMIPQDASQDEFYAEINGVNDESLAYAPWGNKGPRTTVNAEQTVVAGSFDPAILALGAKWTKGDSTQPHFTFHNLHNLIKITIDNQSGKTIDQIILSSSSNMVCKNYWDFKADGSVKSTYSTGSTKEIKLLGTINEGKNSYYMVVPVKNNNGSKFKLDDMHLTVHCETGEYFEAHNSVPLEIDANTICSIGAFTITTSNLNYPYGAPFGTYWGTAFMKSWNDSGFTAKQNYIGLATEDTRDVVTAQATASTSASINSSASGNERMVGKFSFEFVAAQTGAGLLSFWSKPGSSGQFCNIYKNDTSVHQVTYQSTSYILTSVRIEVIAGDIIKIQFGKDTSNAALSCGGDYSASSGVTDRRIRWDYADGNTGSFASPEDLTSNNQPFFNEI